MLGHVAKNSRANVVEVVGVARAAAVVIEDNLQEIRRFGQLGVVLLGAVERAEGVDVPDVKSYLDGGPAFFGRLVNVRINGLLAVGPKFFPSQQFRIVQQQAPEFHEVTVGGTLAGTGRSDELIEFFKALLRAFDVEAARPSCLLMKLAKAGHVRGIRFAAVPCADGIVQRPLALATPH